MFFGPHTTKHILTVVGLVVLGGCTMDNTAPTEPPRASASEVQYSHDVRFDDGVFAVNERERLDGFLGKINMRQSDGVYLVSGSTQLSASRKLLLGDYLTGLGISVRARFSDFGVKVPAQDSVSVVVRRYVATLPGCPDWSGKLTSYNNTPTSNWGCANATNLGLMIAEPQDLVRGRTPGPADGEASARAIDLYRKGETKEIVPEEISTVEGGS